MLKTAKNLVQFLTGVALFVLFWGFFIGIFFLIARQGPLWIIAILVVPIPIIAFVMLLRQVDENVADAILGVLRFMWGILIAVVILYIVKDTLGCLMDRPCRDSLSDRP